MNDGRDSRVRTLSGIGRLETTGRASRKAVFTIVAGAIVAVSGVLSDAAHAYVLDDRTAVSEYTGTSASGGGWSDRIGASEFEVFGVNASFSGNDLNLSLFSNYGLGTGSASTRTADIAFDVDTTDGTRNFIYGLVLFDHGTSQRGDDNNLVVGLYSNATWKDTTDIFGSPANVGYGGGYKDCLDGPNGSPSACGGTSTGDAVLTYLTGGNLLANTVTVTEVSNPANADPGDNPSSRIDVVIADAAQLFGPEWEFLWSGATCGNDTIHGLTMEGPNGEQEVREPDATALLVLGLMSLGLTVRRRTCRVRPGNGRRR